MTLVCQPTKKTSGNAPSRMQQKPVAPLHFTSFFANALHFWALCISCFTCTAASARSSSSPKMEDGTSDQCAVSLSFFHKLALLHTPALLSLGQNPKQQSAPPSLAGSCCKEGVRLPPPAALYDAASTRQETGEMAGLEGFKFFQIILENSSSRLRLPDKFTRVLLDGGKPQEVKLREAGHGRRFWDVKVVLDADGHMYLGRGWEQFARAHDLRLGYFLVLSYDGDTVLTVKVFDVSMCRRHYKHDGDASSGSSSSDGDSGSNSSSVGDSGGGNNISTAVMGMDDGPTSQFTVMLRESNLGVRQKQYLNVPAEFQKAHGYAERTKVELWMRGKSWSVNLKHSPRNIGRPRASLRYGWHQFCVDNGLGVGDTCFFRALREGGAGEVHLLKVEVRKRDGGYVV